MRTFLGIVVLVSLTVACVKVEEPPFPEVVINIEGGDNSSTCTKCDAAAMKGRVYRVTRLEIDEPDAFAQILNVLWQGDVRNNILNVLIVVDNAVAGTGTAFEKLSLTLGPGWRVPKMPYVLPPEDDDPVIANAVDEYCLLDKLSLDVELAPYHGTQCQFKSTSPTSLYFHSGPKDGPLICAPDNQPANNIPISNMSIRASFNDDCTAIRDGFLLGCITVDAADRICMCMGAPGTCAQEGVPGATYEPDALDESCHTACGETWLSFGSIIRSFELAPGCLTPEGTPGYFVQAFFDAAMIPDVKFNPVASDDCSKH
jgi:hypothetical protein